MANYITKANSITNTEHVLTIKKAFLRSIILQMRLEAITVIENNVYNKYDNRIFNITNNITKHMNNHSNDPTNNYKINNKQCKERLLITSVMILQ